MTTTILSVLRFLTISLKQNHGAHFHRYIIKNKTIYQRGKSKMDHENSV
jgi:hypothetical protein